MRTRDYGLSLLNIAGGAVVEKFDRELDGILENLMDPNTTDKKREIVLKVTFKRNDSRNMVDIDTSCVAKPAPTRSIGVQAFMGRNSSGRVEANEILTAQQSIFESGTTQSESEVNDDRGSH